MGVLKEWTELTSDNREICAQIRRGRELALQKGFYARVSQAWTRMLSSKRDASYDMLRAVIGADIGHSGYGGIVLIVRRSPEQNGKQRPGEEATPDRQQAFLESLLPDIPPVPVHYVRLDSVSAYESDTVDVIQSQLAELPNPQLLLAVTTDRLVRKREYVERLKTILNGQHQIITFLWQNRTFMPWLESQEGWAFVESVESDPHGLASQLAIGRDALALPIVWPMC